VPYDPKSLAQALSAGAQNPRYVGAYNLGGEITDRTKSPALGALVYALTSGMDPNEKGSAYKFGQQVTDWTGSPSAAALAYSLLRPFEGGPGQAVVSPIRAGELNTIRAKEFSPDLMEAVQNTPGAQIVPEGLRMRVMRSQQPEQALQDSVRGGVMYLPEGAKQAKYYTGKIGYGGSEKIAGETLIANPLVVKGATGGKAPEMAFDSLLGKGSYQAMRDEALKALGGYNAAKADKVELAEQFLEKYAPELRGNGAYIVEQSTQGNTLPYALQEAAVAHAVRDAGHDAVVGYSESRKGLGKFISEIFDVREKNYPDKFGTQTKIWAKFLKHGTD
jgi:hypothetical protein